MITKGGINAITRSLAIEYAKDGIRVNAVAPGVVDTPMHMNSPKDFLKKLSPMGSISTIQEIVDAVIYLTEAPHVTGEVLHVDGGAHIKCGEESQAVTPVHWNHQFQRLRLISRFASPVRRSSSSLPRGDARC